MKKKGQKAFIAKIKDWIPERRVLWIIFSVIFALPVWLTAICRIDLETTVNTWIARGFLFILGQVSLYLFIVFVCLILFAWLNRIQPFHKNDALIEQPRVHGWEWPLYALICAAVFIFNWMALYPAVMTPDSLYEWGAAHSLISPINPNHSVLYILFIRLCSLIWDSPAAASLLQMILMSAALGYVIYALRKEGLGRIGAVAFLVFYALLPVNGLMSVTIWRDVPYSILLLLLMVYLLQGYRDNSRYKSVRYWVKTGVIMLLFVLVRYNGLLVFVVLCPVMFFIIKPARVKVLIMFAGILILNFVITGPMYQAIDVEGNASKKSLLVVPVQQIARTVARGGDISQEEKAQIDGFLPTEEMIDLYNESDSDMIFFAEHMSMDAIEQDYPKFIQLWFNLFKKNPVTFTSAYLEQTRDVWDPSFVAEKPIWRSYFIGINQEEKFNIYGLQAEPLIGQLDMSYDYYYYIQLTNNFGQYLWSVGLFCLLTIFLSFASIIRYGKAALLISAPVLLHIFFMLTGMPVPDLRYEYCTFLCLPLLGFLLLKRQKALE